MALTCGLIGVPSCGKTTIFNALTAAGASGYSGAEMNRAVVNIPDGRIDQLARIYNPQKVVYATLEVLDIPGLNKSAQGDGRGSRLLAHIKDVDALLHVVRCFEDGNIPFAYASIDAARDVEIIDLEMMLADSVTLENKITRLAKKARAGDKDALRESGHCQKILDSLQQGVAVRRQTLEPGELASISECNLVSQKPVLYIANIKTVAQVQNAFVRGLSDIATAENAEFIAICGRDEADISQLEASEREFFLKELGLGESSMERLLIAANRLLGLVNFFTVGEDEVRAWTCHRGDKAPVAAGKIHTDMESGFIRMEVMSYADLVELGSEAAVVKAGRQRVESREYEVQDGDIVSVLFNRGKG
jgi:GTP-binding protein YchF